MMKKIVKLRAAHRHFTGQRLSIKFILYMARQREIKGDFRANQREQLAYRGQNIPIDIYRPTKKLRGTILIVHGMNSMAGQDPRVLLLCQIMLQLGFIAIVPSFPSIASYHIAAHQCEDIQAVIDYVVDHPSWCPFGRLSIFSASFSGGISIRAAALSRHAKRINGVLSIGVFYDGELAMHDLLKPRCEDIYAHLIAVRNTYLMTGVDDPALDEALIAAIEQSSDFNQDPHHLTRYWQTIPESEVIRLKPMIEQMLSHQFHIPESVIDQADLPQMQRNFDFLKFLDTVTFKVFVIQDQEDKILLPKHTYHLSDYVQQHNLHHSMIVTPLLSHANVQVSLSNLHALWDVVNTVRQFFAVALQR